MRRYSEGTLGSPVVWRYLKAGDYIESSKNPHKKKVSLLEKARNGEIDSKYISLVRFLLHLNLEYNNHDYTSLQRI